MVDARGLAAEAPRGSFTIEPRGPFSLEASIRFLEGFTPAARADEPTDRLDMAFALEGSWRTIGVSVDQSGSTVRGRLFAARALTRDEMSAAKAQVLRILSLDVDGSGFAEVGERDSVVAGLQERYPGLRPVNFYSWYEAAAWAIIGQRTRMSQAAALKERMAQQLGVAVTVNGVKRFAFPAPRVLQELTDFPGLPGTKVEWLRHLADVARRGTLDSPLLRSMPREEALEALEELPGIGPFSAELILLRGAGEPDQVPSREPRLVSAVQLAYELPAAPSPDEVEAIAEGWAPYRTWVTLLLRVQLEEDAAEAGATPGDAAAGAVAPPGDADAGSADAGDAEQGNSAAASSASDEPAPDEAAAVSNATSDNSTAVASAASETSPASSASGDSTTSEATAGPTAEDESATGEPAAGTPAVEVAADQSPEIDSADSESTTDEAATGDSAANKPVEKTPSGGKAAKGRKTPPGKKSPAKVKKSASEDHLDDGKAPASGTGATTANANGTAVATDSDNETTPSDEKVAGSDAVETTLTKSEPTPTGPSTPSSKPTTPGESLTPDESTTPGESHESDGGDESTDPSASDEQDTTATHDPNAKDDPQSTSSPDTDREPDATSEPDITNEPDITSEPDVTSEPDPAGQTDTTDRSRTPAGDDTADSPDAAGATDTADGTQSKWRSWRPRLRRRDRSV